MTLLEIEIVRKFIKAYNSFDIEGMLVFLHPDIQFKNISGGKVDVETNGINEFEKIARQSAKLFSEREQKIISFEVKYNLVIVDIQFHAVAAINLPNGIKKNEKLNIKGKSEYGIKNDLIISIIDRS